MRALPASRLFRPLRLVPTSAATSVLTWAAASVVLAGALGPGTSAAWAQEPDAERSVGDTTVEAPGGSGAERGWLGIAFRDPMGPAGPGPDATDGGGVMISGVLRGSPADRTGIRPGEVLLRIEGEGVGPEGLAERARNIRVGDSLSLTLRGPSGERRVVLVAGPRPESLPPTLDPEVMARVDSIQEAVRRRLDALRERMRADRGEPAPWFRRLPGAFDSGGRPGRSDLRPDIPPEAPSFGGPPRPYSLGAEFVAGARMVDLNEPLAEYFEVAQGVLTVAVLDGSPADEVGLRPGDVIVAAEGTELESVEELRAAMLGRGGGSVELRVVRRGEVLSIRLPS